jgi:phosphonate transport system permease protein
MRARQPYLDHLPPRFRAPGLASFSVYILLAFFFAYSVNQVNFSPGQLILGFPSIGRILSEMFPPDLQRIRQVGAAILETFEMALIGTGLGIILSFWLAILASRSHSPGRPIYFLSRTLISLFRTVPDLVWALLFVVAVGLGPFAGTLAIMIDTIGFCGRFFAEAMEEVQQGPQDALRALGASRTAIIFCAVVPAALPSFINSSLFSLEKSTRSSVILGLVGAGGIGIELKVAMEMFHYSQAATAILAIFALVIAVEQSSAAIRRRIM